MCHSLSRVAPASGWQTMACNLAHCLFLQIKFYWYIHFCIVFHSEGQSCSVLLRRLQRLSTHHLDVMENVCSPSSTFHLLPLGLCLKTASSRRQVFSSILTSEHGILLTACLSHYAISLMGAKITAWVACLFSLGFGSMPHISQMLN